VYNFTARFKMCTIILSGYCIVQSQNLVLVHGSWSTFPQWMPLRTRFFRHVVLTNIKRPCNDIVFANCIVVNTNQYTNTRQYLKCLYIYFIDVCCWSWINPLYVPELVPVFYYRDKTRVRMFYFIINDARWAITV